MGAREACCSSEKVAGEVKSPPRTMSPAPLAKNRFRNSRLVILHASELATELYDELQSLICTFAMSI